MSDVNSSKPDSQITPTAERYHDLEDFLAETMELRDWLSLTVTSSGSFDVGLMASTSFGKLLDALPIPALLIDVTYKVTFANAACGLMSDNYSAIQGIPFCSLVPKPRNAEKALTILKRVFNSRRLIVAEAILEIDARKIWGRLYFRSIRMATDRYILLIIEDLTSEKTQLVLKNKTNMIHQAERTKLKNMCLDRGKRLTQTSEQLCQEVLKHEQTESALKLEEERSAILAERIPSAVIFVTPAGRLTRPNTNFKEWFLTECAFPYPDLSAQGDTGSLEDGPDFCNQLTQWLTAETAADCSTRIVFQQSGTDREATCSAVKLTNGEYLVMCEPTK